MKYIIEIKAEQGDAEAQFKLGDIYSDYGAYRDEVAAKKWYQKAADQGHVEAQFKLGDIYSGHGVHRDKAAAKKWYQKAADQGHAIAQHKIKAEQGDAEAQFKLGDIYGGYGVYRDEVAAKEWYQKAAEQGHTEAQFKLGDIYGGYGVYRDEVAAKEWYQKAAEQGHTIAQRNLGDMYKNGKGVHKDKAAAKKWYQKSADQGDVIAQINLKYIGKELYAPIEKESEKYEYFNNRIGVLILSYSTVDDVKFIIGEKAITVRVGVSTSRGTGIEHIYGDFDLAFFDVLKLLPTEVMTKCFAEEVTRRITKKTADVAVAKHEEKIAIACSLESQGVDLTIIMAATGLTADEINQI